MTSWFTPDATHDPGLRSWVASANRPGHDFPVQNLPFGVFRRGADEGARGAVERNRIGVAIGDAVLDLAGCAETGLLDGLPAAAAVCQAEVLNPLMGLAPAVRRRLRAMISDLLRSGSRLANEPRLAERLLAQRSEVTLALPAAIGDYTDFYASAYHATNVGRMLRPDNPLLPNYRWVPIGYHGRASSVVVSGTPVLRPRGQIKPADSPTPVFGPTRQLDYELELGVWIAGENALGNPVPIEAAEDRVFGISILNDWSARDLQAWEYQPLGPFLAKSFLTSVSPWVVTTEALAPFRAPALQRPEGDPAPLPYLDSGPNREHGGVSILLDVALQTRRMREQGVAPCRLSRSDFGTMYWTIGQLITHHASNGCNLRPGDLLGSGTISGPTPGERGCLLELTWRGRDPIQLPDGEERRFLEDGDEVIMTARGQREGAVSIGLGECRGVVASEC
jgi:fumarylacetoacetase